MCDLPSMQAPCYEWGNWEIQESRALNLYFLIFSCTFGRIEPTDWPLVEPFETSDFCQSSFGPTEHRSNLSRSIRQCTFWLVGWSVLQNNFGPTDTVVRSTKTVLKCNFSLVLGISLFQNMGITIQLPAFHFQHNFTPETIHQQMIHSKIQVDQCNIHNNMLNAHGNMHPPISTSEFVKFQAFCNGINAFKTICTNPQFLPYAHLKNPKHMDSLTCKVTIVKLNLQNSIWGQLDRLRFVPHHKIDPHDPWAWLA